MDEQFERAMEEAIKDKTSGLAERYDGRYHPKIVATSWFKEGVDFAYTERQKEIDELNGKLEKAKEALKNANKSLGYLAKHDMIEEKFNEVSQNGYFNSKQALKKLTVKESE